MYQRNQALPTHSMLSIARKVPLPYATRRSYTISCLTICVFGPIATRRGGAKRTAKKKAQAAAEAYLVTQSVAALTAPPSIPIAAANGNGYANGGNNGNGYVHDPHTMAQRQANIDAMMAAMSAAQQEPISAAPSRTSDRTPHPSHLVGVVDVSFLPPAGSPSKGKVNHGKVEAIVPFAFGEGNSALS